MARALLMAMRGAALAGMLLASGAVAEARGALAIGACGAWGGAWHFDTDNGAQNRALNECRGRNCRVVTTFDGLCAAFAYDRKGNCGAFGWATRATRGEAETAALQECVNANGRECYIRGQFCDGK